MPKASEASSARGCQNPVKSPRRRASSSPAGAIHVCVHVVRKLACRSNPCLRACCSESHVVCFLFSLCHLPGRTVVKHLSVYARLARCVSVCAHAGKHPPPFQQSRDVQYPCGTDGSCGPRAWQGIVQDDTSRTAGTKPHQQAGSRRNAQLR